VLLPFTRNGIVVGVPNPRMSIVSEHWYEKGSLSFAAAEKKM
jgi:hypothetical protein